MYLAPGHCQHWLPMYGIISNFIYCICHLKWVDHITMPYYTVIVIIILTAAYAPDTSSTPDPTEDTTLTHHHHNLTATHFYTTPQHLQNITSILQHHHINNNSNNYHHHTYHLLILFTNLLWCWHSLNVLWMHGWTCDVMEWCKKTDGLVNWNEFNGLQNQLFSLYAIPVPKWHLIGNFNVQRCLLINLQYKPISFHYSELNSQSELLYSFVKSIIGNFQ